MKMRDVKAILVKHGGYRVSFERRDNGLLCSDHFPDRDEPAIDDLAAAWKLAEEWAAVDPDVFVNVYVIQAHDWCPVDGYQRRKLNAYPAVKAVGLTPDEVCR